jgi:hypothetical protein
MMELLERLVLERWEVVGVGGVFLVVTGLVLEGVLGVAEEVGEGAGALALISHLTNIILFSFRTISDYNRGDHRRHTPACRFFIGNKVFEIIWK